MFLLGSRDVLRLLAADGPREWVAGVSWPLHRALLGLQAEVSAAGPESSLPYDDLITRPDPEAGTAVAGAEDAIRELASAGLLSLEGDGLAAVWTVDERHLVGPRRELMRLQPTDVDLIYRAARRWAALAVTSLKKWRIASESSTSMVRSGTPNRRHPTLAGF